MTPGVHEAVILAMKPMKCLAESRIESGAAFDSKSSPIRNFRSEPIRRRGK